ncbi:putative recombination endonuclease subunit [Cronobacter phage S13]|jgi:DNA repair exonuclease SbcCD nuclease subunit|uniref:Calcineurin-like phosphoesterase domain-containing protein n=1 Tax=Cronobacter phage LPCS28 TaxID=2924885 RepID=A0AAE9GB33_9CAUD|nr:putative recombination endonuclease subunit [Cronobacter phage S13]YP_010665823.1 SbcD-like subunit of palindrome specific endonuclease [Cronobacter phage LPCS28]AIA65040.1 putative recombination endonuclease subunit [Cronobacter phage S13]UNY47012.1 hypothetical protein EHEKIMEA_00130 [Cronobacter phage LPCS28]
MIAILGDLHFGVKNDDPWMENVIRGFFTHFVAECKKQNIRTCVQTGDWFDVRKGISHRTMEFIREDILPMLEKQFDKIYVTVGNHDMHYKNKITPNSPRELLAKYPYFEIIDSPKTVVFDGISFDLIPWMCKENEKEIKSFIDNTVSKYNVGHWELDGFYFYRGMKSAGDNPEFLHKYKKVFCGHFHTQSEGGNIHYVGTPYTITLGDANDPRGFWVFNPADESMTFNKNPLTYHVRLYYDEATWDRKPETFKDRVVKIIVTKSGKKLEKVLDAFEQSCHELVIEYREEIDEAKEDASEEVSVKKLMDVVKERVEGLDISEEQQKLVLGVMRGLHAEALAKDN